MRSEREKMLAGDLYDAGAPELQAEMAAAQKWLARYNAALGRPPSETRELLLEFAGPFLVAIALQDLHNRTSSFRC